MFAEVYVKRLQDMADATSDALDAAALLWAVREIRELRALAQEIADKGLVPAT
jgi:hypothetical protein